jgi:hypothetical protein
MLRWRRHPLGLPLVGKNARWFSVPLIMKSQRSKSEVIPPQPILLRRPAPVASEQGLTDSELLLDLLIDSVVKVRSVEPAGNTRSADPDLLKAATEWKSVSAFKDGRAVDSRIRETIIAQQRRGMRIRGA